MMPAVYDVTTAKIAAKSADDRRPTSSASAGRCLRFDGFLKVMR